MSATVAASVATTWDPRGYSDSVVAREATPADTSRSLRSRSSATRATSSRDGPVGAGAAPTIHRPAPMPRPTTTAAMLGAATRHTKLVGLRALRCVSREADGEGVRARLELDLLGHRPLRPLVPRPKGVPARLQPPEAELAVRAGDDVVGARHDQDVGRHGPL